MAKTFDVDRREVLRVPPWVNLFYGVTLGNLRSLEDRSPESIRGATKKVSEVAPR